MPVQSIISQPGAGQLQAAYRPIVLLVSVTATNGAVQPPVVYCDIYFGNVFYKTLTRTQPKRVNTMDSEWQFDIQDAAQEYLSKYLPENGGSAITEAGSSFTKAFCKLRSSGINTAGFIEPEDVAPIQSTSSTPAVNGTGTKTNDFFIINATLQHTDNQDLATHLSNFRTGSWAANCWPLTHRPKYYIVGLDKSDYFPAIVPDVACVDLIVLRYKNKGQNTIFEKYNAIGQPCDAFCKDVNTKQQSGTTDMLISWQVYGTYSAVLYSLDGGPWIQLALPSFVASGLTIGNHTIRVKAQCQCGEGEELERTFPVVEPEVNVCDTLVSDIAFVQWSEGAGQLTFVSTGAATTWLISIDGAAPQSIYSTSFDYTGLSEGIHNVTITPVCANGVYGTAGSLAFQVYTVPGITKESETATGVGGTRTQLFRIGDNVNAGNRFQLIIYSHIVTVIAAAGDTPTTIATKLKDAVNGTSLADWNSAGSAPAPGTNGFPPTASSSGPQLTIVMNWGNSFAYGAYIS